LNFIKSCDGKNNIIDENFSSINNNINLDNEEKKKDEKSEHNLIIHNVFFEWIITKVIRNYTNYLKSNKKDLSAKRIKNILIN
jgi:ribosomal protein S15P/S13E